MPARARPSFRIGDGALASGVFLGLAAVYWTCRSLTFGPGDSPQHVLSALTWGVPSSPGYPLYTMLAHFFSRLPLGPASGAVNGFSGLLHALAAAVFFLLLRRWGCGAAAALAATGLMAFSPLFWFYSEVAEVRALNDLLALGAAYAAAVWSRERSDRALLALAVCVGLGLSHHPTYALILPAVLCALTAAPPGPRRWALLAAAAAAAVLPYLVLYLRLSWGPAPAYNLSGIFGWRDLLGLALMPQRMALQVLDPSAAAGPGGQGLFSWSFFWTNLGWLAGSWAANLTLLGLFLAGLGALRLWRRQRRALACCLLWAAAAAVLCVALSCQQPPAIGSWDVIRAVRLRYYLLPSLALFALAGFGVEALFERVRPALGWLLAAVVAFGPGLLRPVNLRGCDPLLSYARDILDSSGPRDMILQFSDDTVFAMLYLDLVENRVADRVFLMPLLFSHRPYIAALQRRHPGLRLPLEGGGLSPRPADWLRLNPDRALYCEPGYRPHLPAFSKLCSPRGLLIRVGGPPLGPDGIAAQADRFLRASAVRTLAGRGLRDFTQEVGVKDAYRAGLEYYLGLLG
ncbi:MAG: DUF2723 domain-containing protein, partial [Elusimicrobia bacterium]|nr:DUF2723 domain-containing protein [Elusimicrobiota bacterium]